MFVCLLCLMLFVFPAGGAAQPRSHTTTADPPTVEIAGDVSIFGIGDAFPSGVGMHITRNYGAAVALEIGATGEQGYSTKRGHVLAAINGRLQVYDAASRRARFVTLGIARASGLSYRYSPLLGLGVQRMSSDSLFGASFGLRVDLQRFFLGERNKDRTRLVVGAVFAR
jgi:hypothetical protein